MDGKQYLLTILRCIDVRRTVGLFGSFAVYLLEDTKVSQVLICSFSRRIHDRDAVNLTRKSIRFILVLYTLK